MLKTKRILMICLLAALALMVIPAFAQVDLSETLEIDSYAFTMNYPSGWQVSSSGDVATLFSSNGDYVGVVTFIPGMGSLDLDLIASTMGETLVEDVDGEAEIITLGGRDALLYTGSGLSSNSTADQVGVAAIGYAGTDAIVLIAFYGTPSDSEELFLAMLSSVVIDGEGSDAGAPSGVSVGGGQDEDEDSGDEDQAEGGDGAVIEAVDLPETLEIDDYDFSIAYPDGWDVTDQVTSGMTVYGLTDMSSGYVVALTFVDNIPSSMDLESISSGMISGVGIDDADGEGEIITVGGQDALMFEGEASAAGLSGAYAVLVVGRTAEGIFALALFAGDGQDVDAESIFFSMIDSIVIDGEGSDSGRIGTASGGSSGGSDEGESASPAEAEAVEYGDEVEGEINDDTFEVFYTFEGSEGDVVQLSMISEDGVDCYLEVYDEDGELVARNDDSDEVGGLNSFIEVELPADGTYTIRATRFGQEGGSSAGTYVLTLDAGK